VLAARSLVCAHPGATGEAPAAGPLDFTVGAGEWLAILGGNGSGKTALLLTLAGLVPPRAGEVTLPRSEGRPAVGVVFQEPETQFVTDSVAREIAFPLENLGRPRGEIEDRVAELLASFGLASLASASPGRLSGGEMQRVALASALAPRPSCLLLDEPAAYLDAGARTALAAAVTRLRSEAGVAVVWTACGREECPEAERVLELPPRGGNAGAGTSLAPAESAEWSAPRPPAGETLWRATGLELVRGDARGSRTLWAGLSFEIRSGETWVVLGPNGSGKTSLLDALAGWLRPSGGELVTGPALEPGAMLGYVSQFPEYQLFAPTALEDVAFGLRRRGRATGRAVESAARAAIERAGLDPARVAGRAPESLSLGERRRLALAGVLATQPSILLLDEPTVGLDRPARLALRSAIEARARAGDTVVVASHDSAWTTLPGARRLDLKAPPEVAKALRGAGFKSP
jgi:energy-coupling factor transport system ATP-binding protein